MEHNRIIYDMHLRLCSCTATQHDRPILDRTTRAHQRSGNTRNKADVIIAIPFVCRKCKKTVVCGKKEEKRKKKRSCRCACLKLFIRYHEDEIFFVTAQKQDRQKMGTDT